MRPLKLDPRPAASITPAVVGGRYEPVSFWQHTVHVEPRAPLVCDTTCDVLIVGGGFTGLSTAIELKRRAPDLDVVVLESAVVGHGASGRNGGFAMPLLGWDLTNTAAKRGEAGAREAYALMYDAVEHLCESVREHRIECDLERTGYLLLAMDRHHLRALRHEAALGAKLGFEHQWLEGAALREHIAGDKFLGGVFDPRPAIVNPAKLARGLGEVAAALGVRLYEQSPLTELQAGPTVTARTPSATVQAKSAVLAVNGYGGALGFMRERVLPVHTFIVLTEPLSAAHLDAIGWKRRTSLETARNFIHYFRLTADNRIAFGGDDAKLYWADGYRNTDPAVFSRLQARLVELFPALSGIRFTHRWGGVLGVTLDMFPSFGRHGEASKVFYATGYSGHGVALSNYAGKVLAPRVLEALGMGSAEGAPTPFFYGRRPLWLGSSGVRYVGMHAYRTGLRLQDFWRERLHLPL